MDRETLTKKIQDYQNQQQQAAAMAQMCEGAIQDCNFWLSKLDEPKEESNDG